MKVITSWSGGKDSCYVSYIAQQQGHQILSLFTMMMNDEKSSFHMIPAEILDAQANALDLPLIKKTTSATTYEKDFKEVLTDCKNKGAEAIVTGDINEVASHEEGWLNRVCKEIGIKTIKPLWKIDTNQLYLDYIKTGFKAVVVRTNNALSLDWLGRVLDRQFYDDILKLQGVDPCGENGEYHTVVIDGPNFNQKVDLQETGKRLENGFGCLEIKKWQIILKSW
ncbi:MAG: diphthine--ammonia ligase [Candidatus Bathyarchaeia archaeon]|jgi:uncharacterized protein (TIGR00290 family)